MHINKFSFFIAANFEKEIKKKLKKFKSIIAELPEEIEASLFITNLYKLPQSNDDENFLANKLKTSIKYIISKETEETKKLYFKKNWIFEIANKKDQQLTIGIKNYSDFTKNILALVFVNWEDVYKEFIKKLKKEKIKNNKLKLFEENSFNFSKYYEETFEKRNAYVHELEKGGKLINREDQEFYLFLQEIFKIYLVVINIKITEKIKEINAYAWS